MSVIALRDKLARITQEAATRGEIVEFPEHDLRFLVTPTTAGEMTRIWDASVGARPGSERSSEEASAKAGAKGKASAKKAAKAQPTEAFLMAEYHPRLVVACTRDPETRELVWDEDDLDEVRALPMSLFIPLRDAAQRQNLTGDTEREAEKNDSGTTVAGDSSSASSVMSVA